MRKLSLIVLSFISFSFNPAIQEKSFKISGTINGEYSDYVFLSYGEKKDSARVINNKFEFKGYVDRPTEGWLNLKPDANVVGLWIENSDIEISGDYFNRVQDNKRPINLYKIREVKGSYSAEIQKDYQTFYQTNKTREDFNTLLYKKLQTFLRENKSHPYSGKILKNLVVMNPVLTRKELSQLYSLIDTTQQDKEDLEGFRKGMTVLDKYNVGKPFLKFKLPDSSGKVIDTENYLGKVVLVDFWASWCRPCRAKHPALIQLKNEVKKKNFDILSVSIDNDRSSWLKAIEKDKLPWTNCIDINKEVSNELGLTFIPYNYLLDEKGNILGVNVSMDDIEKSVDAGISRKEN